MATVKNAKTEYVFRGILQIRKKIGESLCTCSRWFVARSLSSLSSVIFHVSRDVCLGVCGIIVYSWAVEFHWLGILHGILSLNLALPISPMLNKNGLRVLS